MTTVTAAEQPWLDQALGLDERVQALVDDLSEAEFTAIALGEFGALSERGLGVPHYVDAGTGLRDTAGATGFPAGIALAATFDEELAQEYGHAIGEETRAAGFTVLLGPTLDLARDPRGGRIPEALGEDPYLAGRIGAAHVRGVQANHVITQLKHFCAYNGEDRRTGYGLADRGDAIDIRASTAVLQDLYLRPFRDALDAGAWSMMGSYNRLNGEYACESDYLLNLPRREWGWRGFYCPDFLFAVRDDEKALAAGLDLGGLGGPGGRTAQLVASAPPGVVRTAVANLVRALIGSGLADHPMGDPVMPSTAEHRALAERTAISSFVLLRNQDAALPLVDVSSLALIGPTGPDAGFVVGGSAAVSLLAERLITPADGVVARSGQVRVELAQGSYGDRPLPSVPSAAFRLPDGSGPGVEVEFSDATGNTWLETLATIDLAVDPSAPTARWPRRWRTRLVSGVTGSHRLSLLVGGRATVHLAGQRIMVGSREAEQFLHGPRYPLQAVVDLTAGEPVQLEIDYEPGPAITIPPMGLGPTLRLGWQPPDDLIAQAVAAAARCDAAVVVVTMASGEGMDRDGLALPGDQDELVRQVAAVNPRTVVVLNTPGATLLPWLDEVAAVLAVWYPGERFGSALGAVLFGEAEPGGRLPLTFPHRREHLPGGDHGPDEVPMVIDYDLDGGIGYRSPGVLEHGCVFGFGHGLGYCRTSCEVTAVDRDGAGLALQLTVANHGERETVHVAQLYAQLHSGTERELVGLARIPLAPAERATGEVLIGPEAFARWDARVGRRTPVSGRHLLTVTTSATASGTDLIVSVEDGRVTGWELLGLDPRAE
ncbi:MAG: glycoside hydrolase family 3 C-terminal domain-containing protein [Propionicimonas sp.]